MCEFLLIVVFSLYFDMKMDYYERRISFLLSYSMYGYINNYGIRKWMILIWYTKYTYIFMGIQLSCIKIALSLAWHQHEHIKQHICKDGLNSKVFMAWNYWYQHISFWDIFKLLYCIVCKYEYVFSRSPIRVEKLWDVPCYAMVVLM